MTQRVCEIQMLGPTSKVLLEHSHTHLHATSNRSCIMVLKTFCPQSLKYLLSSTSQKMLANPLVKRKQWNA